MKDKPKKPKANESTANLPLHLKALDEIIDRSESFIMVWRIEPDTWPVEFVSDNVESILGYSADDFIAGRVSWVSITHQDDLQRLEKEVSQYLEKAALRWSQKYRLMTKSGAIKWFRDDNLAFADNTGKFSRITAIVHDITQYIKTEEALRENEEKYSYLVENANDGVTIIQNRIIKYANKRMADMSGYTIEELTGMSTFNLVPPDFNPILKERFDQREQGRPVSNVFYSQMLCKDGTVKEIENSVKSIQYKSKPAVLGIARDITERKRMEERLSREEKYFHALVEHSADIIIVVDRDGVIIYENPAIEQVLGFTRGTNFGQSFFNIFEIIHPDDLQMVVDKFNALKNDPSAPIQRAEIRIEDVNGTWHEFEVTGSNLIQDNEIRSIITNMRDITERKRAQNELQQYQEHLEEIITERTRKLQESEEKFRILFNSIADGISVIDLATGKIMDTNPAALHMFNFTREDIIGTYSFELIAEKDRQRAMEDIVYTIQRGDSGVADWCLLGKDGTEHDCEARAAVVHDPSGKPLYLVNVIRDIGERKRITEAIKESERRYRILADNVSDVILTLNMDLRFTYISQSGARMIALKELATKSYSELEKIAVQDIVTTESYQIIAKALEEELDLEKTGKANPFRSRSLVIQPRQDDKSNAWIEAKVSFIRNDKGQATGIMCILRDITQVRRNEELRMELEQKAQINSRLSSIGEMAAGIAHEINNPLSPIVGFADLLLKEDLTEAVKADLRVIRDCAQQAADITKRLLVFARQTKPIRTLCNINEIAANTIQIMDYHFKTNNILVVTELGAEMPETMADAAQIQQVLLNLVMNAEYEMIKHHGSGNLLVQTENVDNIIRILVKDDGPGIPKEHMDKIFEPFFSTKKTGEGTGLGLSICHGIIAEHNGRIYAESEENKGATFIVELPIVRQSKEEPLEKKLTEKE
jgi:PAS domain S-box-containing protein